MFASIAALLLFLFCCRGMVSVFRVTQHVSCLLHSHCSHSPLQFVSFHKGLPHAIIHIGPHKAASTHIQSELSSLHKQMANANYYWPTQKNGAPAGIKDIANFAFAVKGFLKDSTLELATMSNFLKDSLARNRSIILSTEEFDDMNKTEVTTLRDHLKGFNVTIVFVYRDFLAQLISLHFESNRFEHSFVQFSQSFPRSCLVFLARFKLV